MKTTLSIAAVAILSVLGFQPSAWGQFSTTTGGTTSSGMFGSRTVGQGSSLGSLGSRSFGGTGGLGQGGSAAGASQQLGQLGTMQGGVNTGSRFLRQNVQAGDFVGMDAQSMAEFVGRVGAGQAGNPRFQAGISRQNAGRGANGRPPQAGARGGGTQTQLRTTIRLGFDRSGSASTGVNTKLRTRLAESSGIQFLSSVEVAMDGRTATLRGVVATEHDRALAEQLARLEPGIWKVRNDLLLPESVPPGDTQADRSPTPPAPQSQPESQPAP
jgi:osmotically-inducible protein OsmY